MQQRESLTFSLDSQYENFSTALVELSNECNLRNTPENLGEQLEAESTIDLDLKLCFNLLHPAIDSCRYAGKTQQQREHFR